jgi:hypothetical protein
MTSPETLELEAVDAALAGREVAPEHAELAELALLLRDDRPEPGETWATRMDRRVETRFPARPRRRPRLRIGTWWRPVAVVASLLLPVVLAAALTSGRSGDDSSDGGGGMAGAAQETAPNAGGDDSAGAGVPPEVRSTGNPRSDAHDRRSVQRSATLTLAAPRREIDGVAGRIADVTADVGGFVAASSITSSDGGDLDLRVPANRLDTAIQRISKLARVRGLSRQSLDITGQVVSARDRLREARAERESLLRQLANAVTVNETESIRARLRIVSREIASAHASLRRVRNRANFADVHVTLVRSRADGAEGAWTPGDAFHDALRVLEVAAGVAVIAAAVALPLAIAWLLGWLARRGVTRRRRERALDMA